MLTRQSLAGNVLRYGAVAARSQWHGFLSSFCGAGL